MSSQISSDTPKRILLIGENARTEEGVAAATIRPGELIELTSASKLQRHSTAGGPAELAFALEDALQGNDIDDSYAANARVTYAIPGRGAVVYAWLAGGEEATPGDFLTSNGDGTFKVASGTDVRLLKPLEAVDASDSNDVDERIRCRVL